MTLLKGSAPSPDPRIVSFPQHRTWQFMAVRLGAVSKSYALLLEPLRHVTTNPKFSAVFFRRTTTQITNPGGLWDASQAIYPLVGGIPRLDPLGWSWKNGGKVRFAHLEHEQNKNNWQGAEIPLLCCTEDEQVRMADGSLRAVKDIRVNDMVATLQGPRPVLFTGNRRSEACVKTTVRDDLGRVVGTQTHSETHKVLTTSGWKSYLEVCRDGSKARESLDPHKCSESSEHTHRDHAPLAECRTSGRPQADERVLSVDDRFSPPGGAGFCACIRPCSSSPMVSGDTLVLPRLMVRKCPTPKLSPSGRIADSEPTREPSPPFCRCSESLSYSGGDRAGFPLSLASMESHCARISSEPYGRKFPSQPPHPCSSSCHWEPRPEPSQSPRDHQSESERGAYREQPDRGIDSGLSPCEPQEPPQPSLVRLVVVLAERHLAQEDRSCSRVSSDDEASCALTGTELEDYQGCCSPSARPCGAHALPTEGRTLARAQLQADAEAQIRTDSPSDDLGIVQKCSRRILRYAHPYRGLERTAEEAVVFGSCEMVPCGDRWVIDLTIGGESHYITRTGLVNQNCFDELTHFTESQFWYMISRNRSMSGVRAYVRATCNPDADSWVAKFISWWIDQNTGFPIPERAGVLRWCLRVNDTLFWSDNKEELIEQFRGELPEEALLPKSVTFIPAKLTDNKALMKADPGYMANLLSLPTVERERLLGGNWRIRPSAGLYFQRSWLKPIDSVPQGTTWARGWDLAGTPKTETNNPDFTESVLIGRTPDGRFIVGDHTWMRGSPDAVRKAVLRVAEQDKAAGYNPVISIPQDPAQAGKDQAASYVKLLVGHNVRTSVEARSATASAGAPSAKAAKIGRFSPFSAQCEGGNVFYLAGGWNAAWFDRLEAFPEASKDDCADATSRAFGVFLQLVKGEAMLTLARRQMAGLRPKEPEKQEPVWQPGSVEWFRAQEAKAEAEAAATA